MPLARYDRARSAAASLILALLLFFPGAARAAAPASSSPPVTGERARELALMAADLFDAMYVEPEKGRRIGEELRKRATAGRYDDSRTISVLADRLTGDLQEIGHDKHLGARFDPQLAAGRGAMVRRHVGEVPPDAPGAGPIR